jgi:hypothetical protein
MAAVVEALSSEILSRVKKLCNESMSDELKALLRTANKLNLYTQNDYEMLWFMEHEDRLEAEKKLKERIELHEEQIVNVLKHNKELEEQLVITRMIFTGTPG